MRNKIKARNNDNYCWTHGHNLADDHTSTTCTRPHPSGMHQRGATKYNTMGGNPKAHDWVKPCDVGLPQSEPRPRRQAAASQTVQQPVQQPAQQQFMAPALTMTAPQMPLLQPVLQQPVQQQPVMQMQSVHSMVGMPGYCMMAPSGGMMKMM